MTQRDRPTSGIHLGVIETEDVETVDGHGGERLVDLEDVDVVFCEVEFGEQFRDGERGADAHDARGQAGDGGAAEFGENGLVHFLGFGALHEEDGGGCLVLGVVSMFVEER